MNQLLKFALGYVGIRALSTMASAKWNLERDLAIAEAAALAIDALEEAYKQLEQGEAKESPEIPPYITNTAEPNPEFVYRLQQQGHRHWSASLDMNIFLPQNRDYAEEEIPELARLVEVISDPMITQGSVTKWIMGVSNLYQFMAEMDIDDPVTVLVPSLVMEYVQGELGSDPDLALNWSVCKIDLQVFLDMDSYPSLPVIVGRSPKECLDSYTTYVEVPRLPDFKFLWSGIGLDWDVFLPRS